MARGTRRTNRKPERQYEHPIPSRDAILAAMEKAGRPLKLASLASRLGIKHESHHKSLEKRLRAMTRDGQLLRNRAREYCLTQHLDLVTGVIQAHRDGFGFLQPDDGSEDVYLAAREMSSLWSRDRVAVRVTVSPRGREGRLVEVLERSTTEVVGKLVRERGIHLVVPEGEPGTHVLIPRGKSAGAKVGDIVRATIVEHPTGRTDAIGEVVRVVGRLDDPGIETVVAILSHGLPEEWPDAVQEHVAKLSDSVPASAKRDRVDLRKVPLVTIDGADAKDFDDAVFCEPRGDGWRLIVAIADVSYYVKADSALDQAAQSRGTSVYFPDRVLPMIPEPLSNGLCSLRPNVDRLCLCCEMEVSGKGEVTRSKFYEAVMRSAARLTYEEADRILAGKIKGKRAEFKRHLEPLRAVYGAFSGRRRRRGAIDFDIPQTKIKLDDRGRVQSVHASRRLITHQIIEECMIAANVEAAKRIRKTRIPGLYRVHDGPDPDRIDELIVFLQGLGIKLSSPSNVQPRDLSRVIEKSAGRPEEELIETVILKCMSRAHYQPRNVGHFGLALPSYAHFTSPIRRYPDLLIHRAIKHLSKHGRANGFRYALPEMEDLGQHCSRTERRADEAVWQVEERLKCAYLEQHVGDEFDVLVSSVTPFGLFVRLPELQIDGLIHVTALPRDYYHPVAGGTELTGEHTGATYRLTDQLRARLVKVDVENRKIDFVLADAEIDPPARARRRQRG
ncbi:MAG: ribonuclease R [Candidatus Rariloculaceae bacterium]